MSLTRPDLENVSEQDLRTLIENTVGEDIALDYKRELYGPRDQDKKEFLKDVSSFANTAGGHIVIGMAAHKGIATDLVGLTADLDDEKLRLESLLRDRLEPRLQGIWMQPVSLRNGRRALVIRISKSWNPPHAVVHNKARLVFARNSSGVHEASIDEMRTMFVAGATLLERAREFQHRRMTEVHTANGPFSNFVREGGRIVLHIIPFSAFASEIALDPRRLDGKYLPPIWCSGYNHGYNIDGYFTISGGGPTSGYVQAFRNGIIESAAGDVRSKANELYASNVENEVTTKVEKYMAALADAEILPPMVVMLAGVRMHGTIVSPDPLPLERTQPLGKSDILWPSIILENFGSIDDYRQALKPIFDALWNAAGYLASPSYLSGGRWVSKT
jgi:hypothetical protein